MGQESKPSPQNAKPGPSAIVSSAVAKDKRDAATANLIDFNPTPAVKASQPASKSDTAIIRRRIALWTTALAALVLISLVLLLGPKLYRKFKAWRATQFALQGEELVRENRAVDAVPYIRSAYLLSPQTPEVLRAMAQMLTAYSSPEATNYWNWLLLTTDATDDDRRAAIDCAMQYGLFNEASTMIKDLLARSGGDARNQLIAAHWDT
ncbi:MAG: hypothetical protein LV481_04815, partial [Methylacidiphilales bacterium]|nr:hypothetical protein [Candidatus Methylacidiphilales bacterium]